MPSDLLSLVHWILFLPLGAAALSALFLRRAFIIRLLELNFTSIYTTFSVRLFNCKLNGAHHFLTLLSKNT